MVDPFHTPIQPWAPADVPAGGLWPGFHPPRTNFHAPQHEPQEQLLRLAVAMSHCGRGTAGAAPEPR